MAIYVGRWDCPTCGNKMVLGPKTRCPNCGAPRPENVRFYMPTEAEIVRNKAQLAEARAGVDWVCGHCRAQNKANQDPCHSCGNPRDELSHDVDLKEKVYRPDEVPISGERKQHPIHPELDPRNKPQSKLRSMSILGIIALGLILLAGFIPVNMDTEIAGFRWERFTQMQHYEAVKKEGWSRPANAFDVSSFRDVHHYDQVFRGYETRYRDVRHRVGEERYVCGKRDMGNGYFQDEYCTRPIYETRRESYEEKVYDRVPVYATKYRYSMMEWVARKQYLLSATGNDHNPKWPTKTYSDPKNWRQGQRTGYYYVTVERSSGKSDEEQVGPTYWSKLREGGTVTAKKSLFYGTYYGISDPDKGE